MVLITLEERALSRSTFVMLIIKEGVMKVKRAYSILILIAVVSALVGTASADDGLIFRRNISKTPNGETEEAAISMMGFYVPAQSSAGDLLEGIDYYDAEGGFVETRENAKPLLATYIDGLEEGHEESVTGAQADVGIMGGASFGQREAFAALSLDDGATWKRANLSNSALRSSFTLANGLEYPGDVHYMTHAVAGDQVLAGWLSKYCMGGEPTYTLTDEEADALREDFEITDLYLDDLFGVAGSQSSVDYTLQGWPEVGEVPYSCVWTARGKLVLNEDTGLYDIVWTKAERLTSGRRDANRLEIVGEPGAGFVMVWQEDPKGLRPGQGLGPGEGWSGAIVNQKTDIWYSYIDWDEFSMVRDEDGTAVDIGDYIGDTVPKVALPAAMPIRLSDNNMCKAGIDPDNTQYQPYCDADFDDNGTLELCTSSESWTSPGGTTHDLCVAEDGRVLWGRNGASRPRLTMEGYDSDADGENDSAWVVVAYEELKALGEGSTDEDVEPIDIGKNVWYHSFDMFHPDIVAQGGMLNHPAKDPETGDYFEMLEDEWGNEFYETEIARRFNLMTQPYTKLYRGDTISDTAIYSGTVGILMYKMGIINQGGPADIFLRRLVLPDDFDPTSDNPYDYRNIACDVWEYTDNSNPRYVEGLCKDTGINVSGTNIVACDNGSSGETCAAAFPWDGGVSPFPKVTEWSQDVDNLDDESWENPYDVAKGHRGFIDGDFIMQMYAWSPNWKANSVGNDHYNLYIRRSFDGGLTWTTTPADLGGVGTETCENYGLGSDVTAVCTTYGPGEFEQARNVSQLVGNKITILDPRYSPSGGPRQFAEINTMADGTSVTPYNDDVRDPSYFFLVYETGDNTTVSEGEAIPMDLFYSRAYTWGDEYDMVDYEKDGEITQGWDWLEHDRDDLSGEASITANPGGTFFYAVWNQWREHILEDGHEEVYDSDIWFRRVMYLDDTEATPTAMILASPPPEVDLNAGDLIFVGTGRDNDHVGGRGGIKAYTWESDIDGLLSNEQKFTIPVIDLTPGLHTFSFTVEDNEGSIGTTSVTIGVGVANTSLYRVFLPIVVR
jgi:hypothetical protein